MFDIIYLALFAGLLLYFADFFPHSQEFALHEQNFFLLSFHHFFPGVEFMELDDLLISFADFKILLAQLFLHAPNLALQLGDSFVGGEQVFTHVEIQVLEGIRFFLEILSDELFIVDFFLLFLSLLFIF